jgi:hypothetical protein
MHELVLLRNMHDCGGGDIPIIITSWEPDFTTHALDYWVELSQDKWSDSERNEKCKLLPPRRIDQAID